MKKTAFRVLIRLGIYPHIYFSFSPFKILEFKVLMSGLAWRGVERVLDIGCGEGLQTFLIGKRCEHVTGIDVVPAFIEEARWYARQLQSRIRADFLDRPIEKAGFADCTFDRIFSICVIEHIPNYEEVLAQSLRILKPGGEMIFSADTLESITDPELKQRHKVDYHIAHYFQKDELAALLKDTGFSGVEVGTLFQSNMARELLIDGIRRGFKFDRLESIAKARRLERAEAEIGADGRPGIFLIARAVKPA